MAPHPTPPAAKALTVEQTAEQLNVSAWVVRAAIRKGELRARKLGARWLIPVEAIDEFLTGEAVAS